MENGTPVWHELTTEEIDQNLEQYLRYLKEGKKEGGDPYDKTIQALTERVLRLVEEIATRPLPRDEEELGERTRNVRLLAAWLFVDKEHKYTHKVFLAMLGELRMLVPKFSDDLLRTAMGSLLHEGIKSLDVSWNDIFTFHKEIFTYRISHNVKFTTLSTQSRLWNDYGAACLGEEGLWLLPTPERKELKAIGETAACIDTEYGIHVLPFGKEKLKKNQQNDILAIDQFARSFIAEMKRNDILKASKKRLNYQIEEEVTVRLVKKKDGQMIVETTDPAYHYLQGPVVFGMKSLLYYFPEMFAKNLKAGAVFPAQVMGLSEPSFTIDKTFVDFIVDDCVLHCMDQEYLSLLIDTSQREYVWLTEEGIPVYTPQDPTYDRGEFAIVQINDCGTGRYLGKINGTIVRRSDERFVEANVRRSCIEDFCYDSDKTADKGEEENIVIDLDPQILQLLTRQLFAHQKHLMKPLDRTRILAVARILAEMLLDNDAAEYIEFANDYLRALILFARNENVRQVNLKIPESCETSMPALLRKEIVQLLQQWGKGGDDEFLTRKRIEFAQSVPVLSRIAQIIQTANTMREIVAGASINVLKREVIKMLQIETDDDSDLESENGIYLGVESGSIEFKESVVFPPDNDGRPNKEKQLRNVLRGVCAFLNSEIGGTLYLGVSDQGYVKGVQRDLDALKISSLDTYMRLYIQDPAKELLGLDAIACMRFELLYDNRVVAIYVAPSPYRIIELEGKSYLRINAESREMNEVVRQQILSRKVFSDKDKAANLSMLQQALQHKRQVILHNYASSNSGSITDRTVEAYDVHPDSNLVICLDHKDNQCKVFNLNRIGYVEILDKRWISKAIHKPIHVDVFHMTGQSSYRCILELDLMARNLLIEEFPKSREFITRSNAPDSWIFDTVVHDLAGIGRFVAGLANHIRILDAPELKEYLNKYAKEYLEKI